MVINDLVITCQTEYASAVIKTCAATVNRLCAPAVIKPWLHSYAELAEMDFNSSHVDQHIVSWFPYPIWRDEGMHDLLVRVAKCAADAVAQSGRPISMGAHVMVRVDIALTQQNGLVGPVSVTSCDASGHPTGDQ